MNTSNSERVRSKRRCLLFLSVAIVAITVAVAGWFGFVRKVPTTFQFFVRDAVSKGWVWELSARLENRSLVTYYQTDTGPASLRFTRLDPGRAVLVLSAPGYQAQSIPVAVQKGANIIEKPIEMVGLDIPGLDHFETLTSFDGEDVAIELRPLDSEGKSILQHPCLDLWIGCRVSVEQKAGVLIREETEQSTSRGAELFRGEVGWSWDANLETLFRYRIRIPGSKIKPHPSSYRIVDCLIVVADSLTITKEELGNYVLPQWNSSDPVVLVKLFAGKKRGPRYFTASAWNVKVSQE